MKLPSEGFRFNCGIDICTYPNQYCDDEEQRCGYCSIDICRSDSIPEQCSSTCSDILKLTTTEKSGFVPDVYGIVPSGQTPSVYGAYVIAIVALLLVLILFCQKFLKLWKKSQKNRRSYDPMLPTEVKVVNTGEKKPQEQENRESDADQPLDNVSIRSAKVVTHPHEETSSSHNFGDTNILPSVPGTPPFEEPTSDDMGSSEFTCITQAQNDISCERPDPHILDNSRLCSASEEDQSNVNSASSSVISEVKDLGKKPSFFVERPGVLACTGLLNSDSSNNISTERKERVPSGDNRVC